MREHTLVVGLVLGAVAVAAGHNPVTPIHDDLQVWVAASNPSGLFALFNPALAC